MATGKKNWWFLGRQFLQIMGHADQTPFGIDLFRASEHESPEMPVMFDIPEDGFDFGGTLAAKLLALLREQVLAGLFAKFL